MELAIIRCQWLFNYPSPKVRGWRWFRPHPPASHQEYQPKCFFHLENISRLQLCISDGVAEALSYASSSDLEHCSWILPGSSSKSKNSAARVLIPSLQHINPNHHHHSLAPGQVLQTPPTKVMIPQISSNYPPHPAWISRIKGNNRKCADSTWPSQALLSVCRLLFILRLCIYEVFSSFQARFD